MTELSIVDVAPTLGSAATCSFERMCVDHVGLQIVVDHQAPGSGFARYVILFKNPGVAAYRMLDESWRLNDLPGARLSSPYPVLSLVHPSPWVAELSRTEPIAELMAESLRHYLICTIDECFDVMTRGSEPVVEHISRYAL